jgi:hypothetical protein
MVEWNIARCRCGAMGSLGGDTIEQCPDDTPYPSPLMPVGMRGAQCMWSSLTIRLRMRL